MTKHFENRKQAEADLTAHGFKPLGSYFFKRGVTVTIHPKDNSEVVIVAYHEA